MDFFLFISSELIPRRMNLYTYSRSLEKKNQ